MDMFNRAIGAVNGKKQTNILQHYINNGNIKIGFSQSPDTENEYAELFNDLDYYVFVNVNPEGVEPPFDYKAKLNRFVNNNSIKYHRLILDNVLQPAELTKKIKKMTDIHKKNERNIVFVSNNIQHAAFVWGCFISYSYPDKEENEIFDNINTVYEDANIAEYEKDIGVMADENIKNLLTRFIRANNVRYFRFTNNKPQKQSSNNLQPTVDFKKELKMIVNSL